MLCWRTKEETHVWRIVLGPQDMENGSPFAGRLFLDLIRQSLARKIHGRSLRGKTSDAISKNMTPLPPSLGAPSPTRSRSSAPAIRIIQRVYGYASIQIIAWSTQVLIPIIFSTLQDSFLRPDPQSLNVFSTADASINLLGFKKTEEAYSFLLGLHLFDALPDARSIGEIFSLLTRLYLRDSGNLHCYVKFTFLLGRSNTTQSSH
jgi:hypothetical protein